MESGGRAGYPVIDVRATVVDGSYHEVDSNEMAFEIAGSLALQEALEKGKPVILEPIMRMEVVTPEQFMGDVIGDLNSRRGHIESTEMKVGRSRGSRVRAAGESVRLHHRPAFDDPGPRLLIVRVRPLPGSAALCGGGIVGES